MSAKRDHDAHHGRHRPTELGVIKRQIRATEGVEDVILVWKDALIADVLGFCHLHRGLRNEPMHALARDGVIRFAVEDLDAVPGRWRPLSVALKGLDDREPCWHSCEPPNFYIWRAGGGLSREPGRHGNDRGPWPEPGPGYRGVGSVPYAFAECGDEFIDRREIGRDIERMTSLSEQPERELRRFARGRLTLSCKVHYAQPPGDGVSWELAFEHRGTEHVLHHGDGTHDPKIIARDILAHREEILGRMKEITQQHAQGPQVRRRGFGPRP